MSFAHFDEIYRICCDGDNDAFERDVFNTELNRLSFDPVAETLLTPSNRWWEIVAREIQKEEKERVFI